MFISTVLVMIIDKIDEITVYNVKYEKKRQPTNKQKTKNKSSEISLVY